MSAKPLAGLRLPGREQFQRLRYPGIPLVVPESGRCHQPECQKVFYRVRQSQRIYQLQSIRYRLNGFTANSVKLYADFLLIEFCRPAIDILYINDRAAVISVRFGTLLFAG
jgi:hypothetical protein